MSLQTASPENGGAAISAVPTDILQTHILTRLDGPTLAAASCASSELSTLSAADHLWTETVHSTWPSTNTPRMRQIISTFPNGPRSFFSQSFPLINSETKPNSRRSLTELFSIATNDSDSQSSYNNNNNPSELISAVDIRYNETLIFSKILDTETESDWFKNSPFRIDLVDAKDIIQTPVPLPASGGNETCQDLVDALSLSWILIDPVNRRAVNVSSWKPVSVQRNWLSGDVQVRFASIVSSEKVTKSEYVECGVVISCGASVDGLMQVQEVSLQVEDMDGRHLVGRDSLVILGRVMMGDERERKGGRREKEGKRRYEEFLGIRRERRERKLRNEERLDKFSVFLVVSLVGCFCFYLLTS